MTPAVKRQAIRTAWWLAGVLTIYWRAPRLVSEPRFWAEEGSVYFSYAFNHPWYSALVTPHGPYLLAYTNIVAILVARLVPLPYAPLATTLFAFAVQATPLAIILWSRSLMWSGTTRKLAGALIVLLVPISGEIWLTTTNSQFYFSLMAVLVMLEPLNGVSTFKTMSYRCLLVLAALTGPVSCLLTPLFIINAWRNRNRESIIHATIMTACSAMQFAVVWQVRSDPGLARRFLLLDLPTLAAVLGTNTLAWPFFGPPAARAIARALLLIRNTNRFEFAVFGWLLALLQILWLGILSSGIPREQRFTLLGSYLLLAICSSELSAGSAADKATLIYPDYGGRYFYVPTVVVMMLLLANLRPGLRRQRTAICSLALATAVGIGIWQYRPPAATGPPWRAEVLRWQQDPRYRLRIWPAGWTVTLERR